MYIIDQFIGMLKVERWNSSYVHTTV